MRTPLKGRTSIIISNGEVNIKEMKKAKLEMEQIRTFLRMKGIFSLREVSTAVLETSGQLSVLKKSDETAVTKKDLNIQTEPNDRSYLLIDEGNLRDKNLDEIQQDKE
nr:DUF421 domain-containing protein [Metabacillus arenae]